MNYEGICTSFSGVYVTNVFFKFSISKEGIFSTNNARTKTEFEYTKAIDREA